MVSRTDAKSDKRRHAERKGAAERSAFSFGNGDGAAPLLGALAAGAAIGLGANYLRKLLQQQSESLMAGGTWDQILKLEHEATAAKFDALLATSDNETLKRAALVKALHYALDKHAFQEEQVVYPALREANEAVDADHLEHEHGYVKTYLYRLENMDKGSSEFLPTVREFKALIEKHVRMEEDEVYPRFVAALSDAQNEKITALMNRQGMKMA